MSEKDEYVDWPPEAGDRRALPAEMPPPPALEDRVVGTLLSRGLIQADRKPHQRHFGWQVMRASLAAAACAALVTAGVWIGRMTSEGVPGPGSLLTGAETDLYALLLYETEGYDRPGSAEARARYGEYSRWVAEASRRGQFVTGEDLEVEQGWLLVPAGDGAEIRETTAISADAPLSGLFFVRARDPAHALELARQLPHLKHGGSVLIQKTIPTDTPP